MNVTDFIKKWRKVKLTERSASHQHFLDLCALLDHPTPAEADPEGASFTFERGVHKRGGGDGWADVWKKGFFGWEYKGKHKDLDAAYAQLLQYAEALETPRLLVVCDMERIVVHTHFNDAPHTVHEIPLAQMGAPDNLAVLRAVFEDPEKLRPEKPIDWVTKEAAEHIATIAQQLRARGLDPHAVARFLDRIVFCLFAEDIGLLPGALFSRILEKAGDDPERFTKLIGQLFEAMAHGGDFGLDTIRHFNGNLFTGGTVATRLPPCGHLPSPDKAGALSLRAAGTVATGLPPCGPSPDKAGALSLRADASPDKAGASSLRADGPVIELTEAEIAAVAGAARLDWGEIKPSIFGTLFERGLDPGSRAQLGAHYTSEDDIKTLVEPVVMAPLRREWDETRQIIENLLATGKKHPRERKGSTSSPAVRSPAFTRSSQEPPEGGTPNARKGSTSSHAVRSPAFTRSSKEPPEGGTPNARKSPAVRSPAFTRSSEEPPEGGTPNAPRRLTGARLRKARDEAVVLVNRFMERLSRVTVLDPACGSGNFLYVTLQMLKNLEKEISTYAADRELGAFYPRVLPTQLHGIEINPYAHELAQMTVWIGWLQWIRKNGFDWPGDPILRPMDTFENKDAILDLSDPEHPREPTWPKVDFIVGNPPFLGDKKLRAELGDQYVDSLWGLYAGALPQQSDLCCYWFEKARRHIEAGRCHRAGLLATQGIRGGQNRVVLRRILDTGGIFFAVSDRDWVLDGAAVHISIVGFDDGSEQSRRLDGESVSSINPNLSASADTTRAVPLEARLGQAFIGVSQHGPFELDDPSALALLQSCPNPHGKPNSDVVRPIINAFEIVRRPSCRWVVAFEPASKLAEAALYEAPFEHVVQTVKPGRERNRRKSYRERWWLHGESRPAMQRALHGRHRFLATPRVAKHRVFVWMDSCILPSDAVVAIAADGDLVFGVLQSRPQELWGLCLGTRLETRPRYTPTTCFETFPFPEPTEEQAAAIAEAARELNALREQWLNPPEWVSEEILEFPGSAAGPWARYVHDPGDRGIGTVRYPRLVPRDADCAAKLKKRTLTNLYNARPTWLDMAHRKLDAAVFAAYGWPPGLGDEAILERLLALNLERAGES